MEAGFIALLIAVDIIIVSVNFYHLHKKLMEIEEKIERK